MKTRYVILLVVFSVFCIFSAHAALAHSITGTVIHESDGSPIVNTRVYVCNQQGNYIFPLAGTTQADGTYSIPGIETGQYYIHAEGVIGRWQEAKELFNESWYPGSPNLEGATFLSITEDKQNIDFVLSGHYILGTVKEAGTDSAIPFQDIRVYNSDWQEINCPGFLNEYGEYFMGRLPAGRYYVGTTDFPYFPQYYNQVSERADATLLDLENNIGLTDINFLLESGISLSGRVTDTNGSPVAKTEVVLLTQASNQWWGNGAGSYDITDSNGYYTLPAIAPGTYYLIATGVVYKEHMHDGTQVYSPIFYDNTNEPENATPVTIEESLTGYDFTLEKGLSISGQVVQLNDGAPVKNAEICLLRPDGEGIILKFTDENGQFQFGGLISGDYVIKVTGGINTDQVTQYVYLPIYYENATNLESATIIHLDDNLSGIIFEMQEGFSVSGRITETDGSPVENTEVVLLTQASLGWWNFGTGSSDKTDNNGYYTLPAIAPGTYYIIATGTVFEQNMHQGTRVYSPVFYDNTQEPENATPVTIEESLTGYDFVLKKGLSISGQVVLKNDGAPVKNANIYLLCPDGEEIILKFTDEDGQFQFAGLQSGDYVIKVSGEINTEQGPQWLYSEQYYKNATSLESATIIHLTENLTGILIEMTEGFSISGCVTCQTDNKPLQDVEVSLLTPSNEPVQYIRTDENGYYIFSQLPAGEYVLFAWPFDVPMYKGEYYQESSTFEGATKLNVTENTTNVDFTLEPENCVYGHITRLDNGENVAEAQILLFDATWSQAADARATLQGFYVAVVPPGDYYVKFTGCVYWDFGDYCWWNQLYHPRYYPGVHDSLDAQLVHVDSQTQIDLAVKDINASVKDADPVVTHGFQLHPNYPNPCNPGTTIRYELPKSMDIHLAIFNSLGQKVKALKQGFHPAGSFSVKWDGRDEHGQSLSCGIYIGLMQAGDFKQSIKLLLLQ